MISVLEVQQAIWDKLNSSEYTVVDYIEFNTIEPPYIRMGDLYVDDDSIKNKEGLRCEQYINVYSTYKGKKEVLDIIDNVNELMMNLEIEGHKTYVVRGTQHILQDTDRKTIFTNRDSQVKFYHALLKYEIYIEGVE